MLCIPELIPKSVDIDYMLEQQKRHMVEQLMKDYEICYSDLLRLAIPEIHFKDVCPASCNIRKQCKLTKKCIKFAKKVVKILRTKVSHSCKYLFI